MALKWSIVISMHPCSSVVYLITSHFLTPKDNVIAMTRAASVVVDDRVFLRKEKQKKFSKEWHQVHLMEAVSFRMQWLWIICALFSVAGL